MADTPDKESVTQSVQSEQLKRRLEDELRMYRLMSSKRVSFPLGTVVMNSNPKLDCDDIQSTISELPFETSNQVPPENHHEYFQDDPLKDLEFYDATTFSDDHSSVTSRLWNILSEASGILRGVSVEESPRNKKDQILQEKPTLESIDDDMVHPSFLARLSSRLGNSATSLGTVNFSKDPVSEMTLGRRIALSLIDKKWYYPNPEDEMYSDHNSLAKPSLEKAWAYFEHFTLPRYLYKPEDGRFPRKLTNAIPGENDHKTKLYSPLFTPTSQLGDFGLGIGLYFAALRSLVMIVFIAGLISIPNMIYFSSEEYSKNHENLILNLKGSAICTQTSWEPCPDCNLDQFPSSNIRSTDTGLFFVKKNNCPAPPFYLGMINLSVILFMLVAFWVMNKYQKKMEVEFDLDEQTAQDYSLQITNPPPDAYDPQEWKEFFEQFEDTHVTTCTICVDNDVLLKSLVKRRERYNQVTRIYPGKMDERALALKAAMVRRARSGLSYLIATFLHPFGLCLDIAALYSRIVVLTAEVRGLSQLDNPVTNVFISFETEEGQRRALGALNVGKITAARNNMKKIYNPNHLFRSKHVLHCVEPEEPSTIRWENLNIKTIPLIKMMCISSLLTVFFIAFTAWIVFAVNNKYGYRVSSVVIAIANVVFPEVCKVITELEPHKSDTDFMTSLYVKITFFRYVNTAIVINVITHFVQTLSDGSDGDALIPLVYAIFFADILTTNACQLLDPWGHFKRHVLAPREKTQDFMNKQFQGSTITLAERYTNMSKIIFHGFYYYAIYPPAFFASAVALFFNFFADKFCIMRTWARATKIGTSIGNITTIYILPLDVLAMVVLSSFWWSGFPFDNACGTGVIDDKYLGTHYNAEKNQTFVVDKEDTVYSFCDQNLINPRTSLSFPPTVEEWMSEDQGRVVFILGWTSIAIMLFLGLRYIWYVYETILGLFKGDYKPRGEATGINFSDVQGMTCYIPQVHSNEFSYPLVGACVDGVDPQLFEWKDPDRVHDYYNVMNDARDILFASEEDKTLSSKVFSKVHYFKPPEVLKYD